MATHNPAIDERWWTVARGAGPIVATAIHDGHGLRAEVAAAMALGDADRLREEDPFTGQAVVDVPTHIIVHRSRFEFDLNRGADERGLSRRPSNAGAWRSGTRRPTTALVERSLAIHAAYYRMLGQLLDEIAAEHGRFVLLDVHSYNHRRDGPGRRRRRRRPRRPTSTSAPSRCRASNGRSCSIR